MIKLYEINDLLNDSLEQLDSIEDEKEREEYEVAVREQVKDLILQKSNNLLAQNRYFEGSIKAIDAEIERLKNLKDSVKRHQENFKQMVDYQFKQLNIEKVDTDLGTIKYRKSPLSIEVRDEDIDSIPKEFIRVKTTYSVDKIALKDAYKKDGIKIPNVIYHENESKINFD